MFLIEPNISAGSLQSVDRSSELDLMSRLKDSTVPLTLLFAVQLGERERPTLSLIRYLRNSLRGHQTGSDLAGPC